MSFGARSTTGSVELDRGTGAMLVPSWCYLGALTQFLLAINHVYAE